MFDHLIEISASWDWVTPMLSFITGWLYGRAGVVGDIPPGWSAYTITRYIQAQGIQTHWTMVINGQVCFDVDKRHRDAAYYHLYSIGG